jgi:hypothetical protein
MKSILTIYYFFLAMPLFNLSNFNIFVNHEKLSRLTSNLKSSIHNRVLMANDRKECLKSSETASQTFETKTTDICLINVSAKNTLA